MFISCSGEPGNGATLTSYKPMMPDPMMELMKLKLAPTMELVCFLSGGSCLAPPLSPSTLSKEREREDYFTGSY